jgi:hypothetical protein
MGIYCLFYFANFPCSNRSTTVNIFDKENNQALNNSAKIIKNITIQASLSSSALETENILSTEFSGEYKEVPTILRRKAIVRKYIIEEIYFAVTTNAKRIRNTIHYLKFWAKYPVIKCILVFERNDLMNNPNITKFLAHEGIQCKVLTSNTTNYEERYIELFQNIWNNQEISDAKTRKNWTQWFAIADDDTVWFIDNLLHTLQQYNSSNLIYLGGMSDRGRQNKLHGDFFAYGGGGILLSRPLAFLFTKHTQTCKKMVGNFGGDGRIGKCIADVMNVSLTNSIYFHQNDLEGDLTGFMESGIDGLISLHHMFSIWKPFPAWHSDQANETMNLMSLAYTTFKRHFLKRFMYVIHESNKTLLLTIGYSFSLFNRTLPLQDLDRVEDTGCCADIVAKQTRPKEINKTTWYFRHLTTETYKGLTRYKMTYENKKDPFNRFVNINAIKMKPSKVKKYGPVPTGTHRRRRNMEAVITN